MKGPGLRTDIDVRRVWRCPACGLSQRLAMDVTAPRCPCVRDGVPMKLVEGRRPGRIDLRPELRAIVDRIQGGEEFPRLTPLTSAESEAGAFGGTKSRSRPPRSERYGERTSEPPREPRPPEPPTATTPEPSLPVTTLATPAAQPPQRQSTEEDDFGAGLGAGDSLAPQ